MRRISGPGSASGSRAMPFARLACPEVLDLGTERVEPGRAAEGGGAFGAVGRARHVEPELEVAALALGRLTEVVLGRGERPLAEASLPQPLPGLRRPRRPALRLAGLARGFGPVRVVGCVVAVRDRGVAYERHEEGGGDDEGPRDGRAARPRAELQQRLLAPRRS